MMNKLKFSLPYYLPLLSAYPVLALWLNNIDQISANVVVRPLFFSLMWVMSFFLFIYFVLPKDKNVLRAAVLTSVLTILFFLYGHVYLVIKNGTLFNAFTIRHRTLIFLWICLALVSFFWIKKANNLQPVHSFFNVASLILVVLVVLQIVSFYVKSTDVSALKTLSRLGRASTSNENSPDIYYIILDSYGRSDVLQKSIQYDNSAFLAGLEKMGCYIGSQSQSNYAQTDLSLSSSLNYEYLDQLGLSFVTKDKDRAKLHELIKHSAVRRFLEERGYQTVAFETGYAWTEIGDAEYYFSPTSSAKLNEFEYLLLQTTAARIVLDSQLVDLTASPADIKRERITFVFDKLKTVPRLGGRKFVFAHISLPHAPFVFGPNGESIAVGFREGDELLLDAYIKGYRNQVIFADTVVLETLKTILHNSSTRPIIIFQGDHGPGPQGFSPEDRMGILNVYCLPNHLDKLHASITPVNTFRVILDYYFGQDLPLLEDKSFYSSYKAPYKFELIENPNLHE